jgi:hypothetical protein
MTGGAESTKDYEVVLLYLSIPAIILAGSFFRKFFIFC